MKRLAHGIFCIALLLTMPTLSSCGDESDGPSGGQYSLEDDIVIKVTPSQIDFGTVAINQKAIQPLRITHSGPEGTLVISNIRLEGSADFSLTQPPTYELAPGESTELEVHYAPSDALVDEGQIIISHNASSPSVDDVIVNVRTLSQASALMVIPDPINFGPTPGGSPTVKSAQITNAGADMVTVDAIGFRSDTSSDFVLGAVTTEEGGTQEVEFPVTLAPSDNIYLTLTYTPKGGGQDLGYMIIASNQPGLPKQEVSIVGSELGPEISVSPGMVDLDYVDIGGHAEADIIITNQGTEALAINNIATALGSNEDLSVINLPASLPTSIEPTESLSITVAFDPQKGFGAGTQNVGSVAIESADVDEPIVSVPVYARENSPNLVVTPPDVLDFGFTAVNQLTERKVTLYNGGAAALKVSGLSINGNATNEYAIKPDASFSPTSGAGEGTVEPGLAVEITVSFTSIEVAGQVEAILAIESNDPMNPVFELPLFARRAATVFCQPEFSPPVVQFGIVGQGSSKTMQVKLVNSGSGDCVIPSDPLWLRISDCQCGIFGSCSCTPSNSQVAQYSTKFKFLGLPPSVTMKPGEFKPIVIRFDPPPQSSFFGDIFDSYGALLSATLLDPSNTDSNGDPTVVYAPDGAEPGSGTNFSSNLVAKTGISDVAAIPQQVDFGIVTIGCASEIVEVSIYNKGTTPSKIIDAYLDGCNSEIQLVTVPPLPANLVQGAPTKLGVRYLPQDLVNDACALAVEYENGDIVDTVTIPLSGQGTYDTDQTDYFTQVSGQDVDVLFVVDTSGSMSDEQNNLADNIDSFINEAQVWNSNYRMALTTCDVSADLGEFRGNPRWITPDTPNGLDKFANNVKDLGTGGSGTEEGLEAAYQALTMPNIFQAFDEQGKAIECTNDSACGDAGCYEDPDPAANGKKYCGGANWGFLREDASLEVVIISDEDDQSPADLGFYIDFLKNLKGYANVDLMHIHSIVGDVPGGCDSSFGEAYPADAYTAVAAETGGIVGSICDPDYGTTLGEIGEIAFGLKKQFFLSRPAQPATITVKVKGMPCPAGWTFDVASNSVIFDEFGGCMPQPGDEIEIYYETLCIAP